MKKERTITIEIDKINDRQWSTLLIELNLMKQSWTRFGVHLVLKARNIDKIIKWGKSRPSSKNIIS